MSEDPWVFASLPVDYLARSRWRQVVLRRGIAVAEGRVEGMDIYVMAVEAHALVWVETGDKDAIVVIR